MKLMLRAHSTGNLINCQSIRFGTATHYIVEVPSPFYESSVLIMGRGGQYVADIPILNNSAAKSDHIESTAERKPLIDTHLNGFADARTQLTLFLGSRLQDFSGHSGNKPLYPHSQGSNSSAHVSLLILVNCESGDEDDNLVLDRPCVPGRV